MNTACKESALYKAAKDTLVEYFQKTSLNGFGLLYYIRRRKYQRTFWFMFILLGLCFAAYVVLFTLINFLQEPTLTSLISQYQPIWAVPFPAVAVCSVNKLSRRAVESHIREIAGQDAGTQWLERMQLLAGFFDIKAVAAADINVSAEFESKLFGDAVSGNLDVAALLIKLSPSCQQLLVQCHWAGRHQNCEHLFDLHATATGNCCIFNWQFETNSSLALHYPNGTGSAMGLTLLLNASTDDYFYADRSVDGFILRILEPGNFLDANTGAAQELVLSAGEHVEVELSLTTQITTAEARQYAFTQRRCYFADEYVAQQLAMGAASYSQQNCLSRCKIQSIFSWCGCVPYYTPINNTDSFQLDAGADTVYCSFAHFLCLQRHQTLLSSDYLPCGASCLPLCSYNQYHYRKRKSHYANVAQPLREADIRDYNLSLVTLYFPSPHATEYRKNVLYNWYQILSTIGGVIGICMGCSFISGFEIVYFLVFRFVLLLYKRQHTARDLKESTHKYEPN